MKYSIEDTFDIAAEPYWEMFFSEAFNAAMWPELEIDWKLLKFERQGEGDELVIVREQHLAPQRELPGFMKKLVGQAIGYTEHNVFRAKDNAMESTIVPNVLSDRLKSVGVYRVERLGDNKINRIWEADCTCRVPLVGGRVEKHLVDDIRNSYRRATDFTRRWIHEHKPGS